MYYKLTFPQVTDDYTWYRFRLELKPDSEQRSGGFGCQYDSSYSGGPIGISKPYDAPCFAGEAFQRHYGPYVSLLRWHGFHVQRGPIGYFTNTEYAYRMFCQGGDADPTPSRHSQTAQEYLVTAKRMSYWGYTPQDGDFLTTVEQYHGDITELLADRLPHLRTAFVCDWQRCIELHHASARRDRRYKVSYLTA